MAGEGLDDGSSSRAVAVRRPVQIEPQEYNDEDVDRISVGAESAKSDGSDLSFLEAALGGRAPAPKKIGLPTPIPTYPDQLKHWHFDLVDACTRQYPDNTTRIRKFLDKARDLKVGSNWLWTVPHDLNAVNTALVDALTAVLKTQKELWDRIEEDKKTRRLD